MEHLKCLILLLFIFAFTSNSTAQDAYNPWVFGLGINAVNNPVNGLKDPIRGLPLEAGRYKVWNMDASGIRFTAARYIKYGFLFETVLSHNKVLENYPTLDKENSYLAIDGMVKYNLSPNSKPVGWFNPYVGIGGGYTWLDDIGSGTFNGTVGLNLWMFNNLGLNVQTTVKNAFKDYGIDHFQHSAGVVYKFGGRDTDKDGIYNSEDDCPKEFGLAKLKGCPDTDNDGIKDEEDACPEHAGLAKFEGCPDTDNDGIMDKNDACPDIKGIQENNGCPSDDDDDDGVKNSEDQCPNAPGLLALDGCPDKDGDGLADKDDECPDYAGAADNNGCPGAIPDEEVQRINSFAQTILFKYGNATLTNEVQVTLDEIVIIMKTYKEENFIIEGHTDNTSSIRHNLYLSQRRANAVKNYFISQGIEASRLFAKGYGETRPLMSNKTKKGRLENRRVEIKLRN